MSELNVARRGRMALLACGCGVAAVLALGASALAQSELDSYELAVGTQSKEHALAFLSDFRSSHLAGDLIDSLAPEVARQVCAELPRRVSREARDACEKLSQVAEQVDRLTDTIRFERGSAALGPDAVAVLDQQLRFLREYPGSTIGIDGYADDAEVGTADEAYRLALQRALAVNEYLVSAGFPAERVAEVSSLGRIAILKIDSKQRTDVVRANHRKAVTRIDSSYSARAPQAEGNPLP